MRVILGLVLWSMAEISAFVVVGGWIGLAATLVVVIGSAVAGVMILQRLGQHGLRDLRQVRGGMAPGAHAGLTVVGAIFLILPGFLTDVLGLLLMIPFVRLWLMGRLMKLGGRLRAASDDVIEAEVIEVKPDALREPSGWTRR